MKNNMFLQIKREYDRRHKAAIDAFEVRKSDVYKSIPALEDIENSLQLLALKCSREILLDSSSSSDKTKELVETIERLKDSREHLLADAGYLPEYLAVSYSCPRCKDTGYMVGEKNVEKCSCFKQLLINHLYGKSNLKLTEKENFNSFDETVYTDKVNEEKYGIKLSPRENILLVKERCLKFIDNFSSSEERNLFFSGPTGVGKTFMSSCIAKELLDKGFTVLYQTAPALFNTISEYKVKAYKEDEYDDESYKNIFSANLLIIDDLGIEPPSAARYAELLNILNTRHINNQISPCKIIISTNIGARKLEEYYTERVMSRIMGYFDRLMFSGDDIRNIRKSI